MKAVFVELPPFQRYRDQYLTDDEFHDLQLELFRRPDSGNVIPGTGDYEKFVLKTRAEEKASEEGCVSFFIDGYEGNNTGYSLYITKMKWMI